LPAKFLKLLVVEVIVIHEAFTATIVVSLVLDDGPVRLQFGASYIDLFSVTSQAEVSSLLVKFITVLIVDLKGYLSNLFTFFLLYDLENS
jgi:hypothetical protein